VGLIKMSARLSLLEDIQSFGGDTVTKEVEVNFYVFGQSMEGGVGGEVGDPDVVTP